MISQEETTFMQEADGLPIQQAAEDAAELLRDKKAEDVSVLDVTDRTVLADYFILASARSAPQARTLAEHVMEKLWEKYGIEPQHKEGLDTVRWILLDYGDIVVHIFQEEERAYYDLDKLWFRDPRKAQPAEH